MLTAAELRFNKTALLPGELDAWKEDVRRCVFGGRQLGQWQRDAEQLLPSADVTLAGHKSYALLLNMFVTLGKVSASALRVAQRNGQVPGKWLNFLSPAQLKKSHVSAPRFPKCYPSSICHSNHRATPCREDVWRYVFTERQLGRWQRDTEQQIPITDVTLVGHKSHGVLSMFVTFGKVRTAWEQKSDDLDTGALRLAKRIYQVPGRLLQRLPPVAAQLANSYVSGPGFPRCYCSTSRSMPSFANSMPQ